MSKPMNVLYILTDQHRFDMLGCSGHPLVRTPHIDQLAREGMIFDHAFTPTAICLPARASMLTGVFPCRHGLQANTPPQYDFSIADDLERLPQRLPGYDYLHLGKWHAEENRLPRDYGAVGHNFDGYGYPGSRVYRNFRCDMPPKQGNRYAQWLEEKGYETPSISESYFGENPHMQFQELMGRYDGHPHSTEAHFIVDEAITLLRERDASRPFFMWMNFWGPHSPSIVPEPWYSMYERAAIAEDPAFARGTQGKPVHVQHISRMWGVDQIPWSQWQKIIACYYGYITMIDDCIGQLIRELKERNLYDTTLIVFTADHGDAMGAHRLIEKGEFMYDTCYRIPMVARMPGGITDGRTCSEFVYLHDLHPTAVELATGQAPDMQGQSASLMPLLRGQADGWESRDCVFGEFTAHFAPCVQRMIRTRTHKFIYNAACEGELYDLKADPWELENCIDSPAHQPVKRELIKRLLAQMKRQNDPARNFLERIAHVY